jgi:hypothetical protein
MTAYVLLHGPSFVRDDSPSLLTGFYRAEFAGLPDGQPVERFLTEGGRADLLHRIDRGQREFTHEELVEFTVEPDVDALQARYDKEAGVGG